ncbi:hypothetical protein EVAR_58565_1 [Eumeta japonica]|uniref:Uncharacterized protein n=1 Tax=Eumeta variegata TaxID=151549 RepID=A0A4C1YIQ1_EUMVA|nr:hypothetical protein EVAR_58565_1 [Eumeta japonica]
MCSRRYGGLRVTPKKYGITLPPPSFFIGYRRKQEFLWNKSSDTRNLSDSFDERPRDPAAGMTVIFLFVISCSMASTTLAGRSDWRSLLNRQVDLTIQESEPTSRLVRIHPPPAPVRSA